MKDSVIILSGGLDSTVLLYEKKESIALAIGFDYGAKNRKELEYAEWHCKHLGIEWLCIRLPFFRYFTGSLLEGDNPEGEWSQEKMDSVIIPFRNGIFLSIAGGIAESRGLNRLYLGIHDQFPCICPDNTAEFIKAMNSAFLYGTSSKIIIEAPYIHITKMEIARKIKELDFDYTKTWSCYNDGAKQCGNCPTCIERKEALQEAGIEDKTEYDV